ncbi:putative transcription factor C3H family [Medicago truncatula]|uniref:Putative transcription factor C3H family n=1 Tax=Medicago truncatula TaxID=3880 RepID=A0A396JC16_MEDTR|nr:putative transcription factor C3H family [Medicago truncatula]
MLLHKWFSRDPFIQPFILYVGLPNISNAQNVSCNTFGLLPAVPNGGLDMLHQMGLQGTLRTPIDSSLNVNIPCQRCRDFEECGFCLRGDMCPMEHGVNRIVVEDVQSFIVQPSCFTYKCTPNWSTYCIWITSVNNLTASMNSKCKPGIISKSIVSDVGLPMDGAYPGPGCTSGADLYDPDQPLWNDRGLESSNALLNMQSSKIDDAEPMSSDAPNRVCPSEATRTSGSLHGASSSVWGRIGGSKTRFYTKRKI